MSPSTSTRLIEPQNGNLEIHAPKKFTAERPAVSYNKQSFEVAIEDHPLAMNLPTPTEHASFHPSPRDFQTLCVRPDAPSCLQDFLAGDVPLLSLQISTFTNATLIGLSWCHTLMDVMGQQALLRAWSLVLAGREMDVPALLGAREDAMEAAANSGVQEEYVIKQRLLKGWGMVTFGARFAWDILTNRTVETRVIYMPKAALASLRLQAQNDLAVDEETGEKPFISNGDVLTAWAISAVASSLPSPRPITALHALNARFRISSILNAPGVYVQNMAIAAFTFLSAEIARGPLGPIALENRKCLMEQATEPQILASLRDLKEQSKGGKVDPATMLYSDPNAVLMPFTNWERANFFEVAVFGGAVVRDGGEGRGKLVYHHASSMRASASERNILIVLGKNLEGNYWLSGSLLPAAWVKIEESLKDL